jgi:hypothetical protein
VRDLNWSGYDHRGNLKWNDQFSSSWWHRRLELAGDGANETEPANLRFDFLPAAGMKDPCGGSGEGGNRRSES